MTANKTVRSKTTLKKQDASKRYKNDVTLQLQRHLLS